MKTSYFSRGVLKSVILTILIVTSLSSTVSRGEDTGPDRNLDKLIHSLKEKSREQFIESATPEMKKAISEPVFQKVCATWGTLLKQDYTRTCLGTVNKGGSIVYIYRFEFTKKRDDLLGLLSMKNGMVSGLVFN